MSFDLKSRLKPEGTIMSGFAVVGSVFAIYNMDCGPVSNAHYSDPNNNSLESSRKKAAITSFLFVSAITLLTRDSNVGTLGYASLIAADVHYRQAIMANPSTGKMVPPSETAYTPAMYAVPDADQGQPEAPQGVAVGY